MGKSLASKGNLEVKSTKDNVKIKLREMQRGNANCINLARDWYNGGILSESYVMKLHAP
jgi:hypothetical protein